MPKPASSSIPSRSRTRCRGQPRHRRVGFAKVRAAHDRVVSVEQTVRREQTRVTGYGCRRGENLRRVMRWRERCIGPKSPQGGHERSSRNPANPMSGDGMQQARAPVVEKAVEVVHVPQGRNESAGRHPSDRTWTQQCVWGEWTQQGENRRRGDRQAQGSQVTGDKPYTRSRDGASKGSCVLAAAEGP